MITADLLITKYGMHPHPEGGHYVETYRSHETLPVESLPERFTGSRAVSTAIYFLLRGGEFSSFHRIKADEIWHHYLGDPVEVILLDEHGELHRVMVGSDILSGHHPQFMVPAGAWFASRCVQSDGFSFVGCTVAPGFDFADFELGRREELIAAFPDHRDCIHAYCRG